MISVLLHAAAAKAAPILWASLGGLYSERSGVVNIGLEGMMLAGAFFAVLGSGSFDSPWAGIFCAAIGGGLFGLLHAWLCLRWKVEQIISGIGINLIAMGVTGFLLLRIFNAYGNSPSVPKLPSISGDFLNDIPILHRLVFPLGWLHLVLIAAVVLIVCFFRKTVWGLRLRATGENPHAVRSAGIRPERIQYLAVTFSGILAGIGGAQLAIGDISAFHIGMTNGRGFIALAALICGRWTPGGVVIACLGFGFVEAMGEHLQGKIFSLPAEFYLALPFVLALLALAATRWSARPPAALGKTGV
ncbi:MAG TPA: ABC transporter permease [bacterium]|nr:ABC transporter permease [bacterium]